MWSLFYTYNAHINFLSNILRSISNIGQNTVCFCTKISFVRIFVQHISELLFDASAYEFLLIRDNPTHEF